MKFKSISNSLQSNQPMFSLYAKLCSVLQSKEFAAKFNIFGSANDEKIFKLKKKTCVKRLNVEPMVLYVSWIFEDGSKLEVECSCWSLSKWVVIVAVSCQQLQFGFCFLVYTRCCKSVVTMEWNYLIIAFECRYTVAYSDWITRLPAMQCIFDLLM